MKHIIDPITKCLDNKLHTPHTHTSYDVIICILSASVSAYLVLKVDIRARRQQDHHNLCTATFGSYPQCRLPALHHIHIIYTTKSSSEL